MKKYSSCAEKKNDFSRKFWSIKQLKLKPMKKILNSNQYGKKRLTCLTKLGFGKIIYIDLELI